MRTALQFLIYSLVIATALISGWFAGQTWPKPDQAWSAWLNTWQTLIAGLLAVVAAFLAVMISLLIEANQNKRHRETMSITFRDERRRIERAAFASQAMTPLIQRECGELSSMAAHGWIWAKPSLKRALQALQNIDVFLSDKRMLDAETVLEPAAHDHFLFLQSFRQHVKDGLLAIEAAMPYGSEEIDYVTVDLPDELRALHQRCLDACGIGAISSAVGEYARQIDAQAKSLQLQ